MSAFLVLLHRDLLIAVRRPADAGNPLAFFVFAVVLLGMGVGTMTAAAPGAVWVLALFVSLWSVEGVFRKDVADGSLEQWLILARPRFAAVLGTIGAKWLVAVLPVVLLSPVALLALGGDQVFLTVLTLLLGTPTLTLLGAVGAALTSGGGRDGLLLATLVLPFYLPVLIFGTSAAAAPDVAAAAFELLMLAALLTGSLTLAPFAVSKALEIGQTY